MPETPKLSPTWVAAWSEVRTMTQQEAVEYALESKLSEEE
jgi:hypothetical protein